LNETLFKDLEQPLHHFFGPLLSFTSIPVAWPRYNPNKVHTYQRFRFIFGRF